MAVMFCGSDCTTNNETINSVSGLVSKLGGTIMTCLLETQNMITLITTGAD